VDVVLDAGDLTDLGSDFESSLVKQFGGFNRPHVFVAGNHDSAKTISTISHLPDTYVPNERVVTVAGIRVLGQNDPAMSARNVHTLAASPTQLRRASRKLDRVLRSLGNPPDVLMVHEPKIASKFVGRVPIIISGHDHTLAMENNHGTAWVRPGSTGAEGIRYFNGNSGKSMTAVILYVTHPPRVRAVAVDMIAITSPKGEFTVRRKMLR
jgi:predicted phosphodiesterase